MSKMLELPDPLYDALVRAAERDGATPADWIAARLAEVAPDRPTAESAVSNNGRDGDAPPQPRIIDRGRGPEIAGTRILVLDIFDYAEEGWDDRRIALELRLSTAQVRAARHFIAENRPRVEAAARRARERAARGNPPEIQAKLAASREKLRALLAANADGDARAHHPR